MFPFTKLRSPVPIILVCSVVEIFIPKPELNPMPREPESDTFMAVEAVPLLSVPAKVRSLAVNVSALLVVDKEPDERVKSPEPLLSVSASMTTAPTAVRESSTVIPLVAFKVNDPAVLIPPVVAPKEIEPAEAVIVVPLAKTSWPAPELVESASIDIFPAAVNVLSLKVKPLAAVIVRAPGTVKASETAKVEPVEIRVNAPRAEMPPVVASRERAPPALRVMPLPRVSLSVEAEPELSASASIASDPVVLIPLFKVIPLLAEREIAPAPVMAPVIEMLEGADKVRSPAVVIPPLVALSEMLLALVKVMPLAKLILSVAD
jgi:hypothetical protein